MTRVRGICPLSAEQQNDWAHFCTTWDRLMAEERGKEWGTEFAQIMQAITNRAEEGNANALSEFMYSETRRVLGDILVVKLPGMGP